MEKVKPRIFFLLAAASLSTFAFPLRGEAPQKEALSYREAFEQGRHVYLRDRKREPSFAHRREILFGKAEKHFRQAFELAQNDREKAAALLALGEMQIYDYDKNKSGLSDIRETFTDLLELSSSVPETAARAYLGMGEACLREKDYPSARLYFSMAEKAGLPLQAQLAAAVSLIREKNYGEAAGKLKELVRPLEEVLSRDITEENRKDLKEAGQMRQIASGYLAAVQLLPRINKSRPRLFFNSVTWPDVKARALGEKKDYFDLLRKRVENMEAWEISQKDYGIDLMTAAFVYRVTGSEPLLEKIKAMFRATLDCYLSRKHDHQKRSYSRIAAAAALDWLWEDLAPDERKSFASDLLNYAYAIYLEDKIQERLDHQPWYYVQNMFWYTGLALLDESLGRDDYFVALTLMGQGYDCNRNLFAHMENISGDDGAWHLKPDYAFAHIPTVFWTFAHTWHSAVSGDIPGSWIHINNPDYALRNYLGPAGEGSSIRHFGYARSWGNKTNGSHLYYSLMEHFRHFFGTSHPDYASIAGHLNRRIENEFQQFLEYHSENYAGIYPVNPFFFTGIDKAPPPAIPEGMPVARHFENGGQVLMSSGFGEDDTYALFSAGGGKLSSDDYDTTHFSIYKQGDMALDSGSGNLGSHTSNYARQTVAHNAVLIHMEGEKNYGGQNRTTSFAKVAAFETSPLFSYTATDASETYAPEKCKEMVRQFIYLNPDHFVVFDRAVSTREEYPKEWLLHTSNEPAISGKAFQADQGKGRIFCRTLYPADAVLEKTGGPGKEFMAGGKNWPLTGYFARFKMKGPGDEVPETLGRWRVEVKPGSARKEDIFLHLIQVSGQEVEKMAESSITEDENRINLTFSSNGRTYNIGFNKRGEVGGQIKITEGKKTLIDRELAREIMPQSGLALQE